MGDFVINFKRKYNFDFSVKCKSRRNYLYWILLNFFVYLYILLNHIYCTLLPTGSCKGNCCTMCFLDCFMCVYVKVFVIKITNKKWTAAFADTKSESFRSLEKDLDKAITHYFSQHAIKNYGLTLLEIEGNFHDASVDVYMMLTSRNKWSEDKSLDLLKTATESGHLGQFNLTPNSFKVMEESEYRYKVAHKKPFSLDITETVVTCFAASVIISAIIGILYLYCTTPSQRCTFCKRSRIH